jgi:uncharacterized protein YeaO (DUF488 family)
MSRHTLNDGITPDARIDSSRFDLHYPDLAPSPRLIGDYYKRALSWPDFEARFREEMKGPKAISAMGEIVRMAREGNVTLLCIEEGDEMCHRRLLVEIMGERA